MTGVERIQAHRLMRLMRLMIELGSREFHSAEELYRILGVSRAQFYADKADLEKMGFSFSFDHRRKTFAMRRTPG
jgi:predicted DNA-binding transcriptional regulator YafY